MIPRDKIYGGLPGTRYRRRKHEQGEAPVDNRMARLGPFEYVGGELRGERRGILQKIWAFIRETGRDLRAYTQGKVLKWTKERKEVV